MKRSSHFLFFIIGLLLLFPLSAGAAAGALQLGDKGEGVEALQAALMEKGHYSYYKVTGYFGEATEEAVKKFQASLELSQDGVAGKVTLRALLGSRKTEDILDSIEKKSSSSSKESDSSSKTETAPSSDYKPETLYHGLEDERVEDLQDRLKDLGYMSSSQKSTGYYGDITEKAVEKFQAGHSMTVDGLAGARTISQIYSDDAKRYSKVKTQVEERLEEEKQEEQKEESTKEEDKKEESSSGGSTTDKVADFAKKSLGKPYVYATSGPSSFDCSGFAIYVMKEFGVTGLARSAKDMGYSIKNRIERSDLRKGDLLFFNTNRSDSDLSDHVGIYLGGGKFIHASSSQRKVVITDIDTNYWKKAFSWGGRFL